ncbi:haloacid dehalogenase, type II [Cladophialophora bantiana CBS 173.52]|uniref:Haloacid dehalogenase, type II n=1 Tax=Cladophialophora bantiana (strain ATCC 10958 / CBS 173.52 / CDC B-1940 / NIH 8579) TaxID=1442370 RepID=A0A0D2GFF8_CLAB1|nr:haloacid dehalogenase, type II [Cladophialophora bantiana CBS 173.52]KIW97092.1 haloacid dehalogenase, type II [Cladophialophora bantiana CBS 173.52]
MSSDSYLPMPAPTVPKRPLSSYKLISYDIYGTLVDWETAIVKLLQPLVARIPSSSPLSQEYPDSTTPGSEGRIRLAAKFNDVEHELEAKNPSQRYDELLEDIYLRFASDFGVDIADSTRQEAKKFGESIGTWPPFPDTVDACQRLVRHGYKLVPVSNVDRASFSRTCAGPLKGVDFFRVYTAQDIGSYKPDLRNFEYLIQHAKEDARVEKHEILHVAQSIFHDHVPAKTMGLASVWINRKGAGMGGNEAIRGIHERGEVGYGWRFGTLGELADEVEKERSEEGK